MSREVLITSPLSNLIKMQADGLLSTIHMVHIEKLLMTTLLSVKERLGRLDNVILLLFHSLLPHVAKHDRNLDNTNWLVWDPVINQCWHANLNSPTLQCMYYYTKHVCVIKYT